VEPLGTLETNGAPLEARGVHSNPRYGVSRAWNGQEQRTVHVFSCGMLRSSRVEAVADASAVLSLLPI
jgi:hypothetical protein